MARWTRCPELYALHRGMFLIRPGEGLAIRLLTDAERGLIDMQFHQCMTGAELSEQQCTLNRSAGCMRLAIRSLECSQIPRKQCTATSLNTPFSYDCLREPIVWYTA